MTLDDDDDCVLTSVHDCSTCHWDPHATDHKAYSSPWTCQWRLRRSRRKRTTPNDPRVVFGRLHVHADPSLRPRLSDHPDPVQLGFELSN